MSSGKYLIVVAGPTAVGKTGLCIKLAREYHCEIISADSRQFFKELEIGTAKPKEEEMEGITHHFVNFLSIENEFSAGKFELAVVNLLAKLFNKTDLVIMTGGSGLYIQAVCHGMNDIPEVDPVFRQELYEELDRHGLQPLVEELRYKDPEYYESADKSNTQRIIRALEICRGAGRPYSSFREDKKMMREFDIVKIGLDLEREQLFSRIDARMDQMIADGLFDEAKKLYPFRHLNALKTVGYKEIFNYIEGKYDKDETIRLLKRNSRRYAKRQLTWFKKDEEFAWFHPDDVSGIIRHINLKTNKHDS